MVNKMKLISENFDCQVQITEAVDENQNKTVYLEGIFAQAEKKNRNNRVYPKRILENAVKVYNEEFVRTHRALGELLHPSEPTVNPERACILIESLSWSGNDVIGKAKILTTPIGNTVRALIKDGVQLGVSTRGLGSVRTLADNTSQVEDDFTIKAIDVVHNPSGIDCFVNGIMEGVDWYYDNGLLKAKEIEAIEENIRKNDIKAIQEDFSNFMNRILSLLN